VLHRGEGEFLAPSCQLLLDLMALFFAFLV
jgi:hypothetical protein